MPLHRGEMRLLVLSKHLKKDDIFFKKNPFFDDKYHKLNFIQQNKLSKLAIFDNLHPILNSK